MVRDMKRTIKNLMIKLKMEKYFDLLDYFFTFYKNNVASYPILLNDKDLKKRLIDMGIPIIVVKQKNYFELQGTIYSKSTNTL